MVQCTKVKKGVKGMHDNRQTAVLTQLSLGYNGGYSRKANA